MTSFKFIGCFTIGTLFLSACAPKMEPEAPKAVRSEEPSPQPLVDSNDQPYPQKKTEQKERTESLPPSQEDALQPQSTGTTPSTPDWQARYQELITEYRDSFVPPETGQVVTLELKSGRRRKGRLVELTKTGLSIEISNGRIQYPLSALSLSSARGFFADVYAVTSARQHALGEYRRWQAQHPPEKEVAVRPSSQPAEVRSDVAPPPSPDLQEERMFPIPPHLLGH